MSKLIKTDILLPAAAESEKWAVVSCDQFTSQKEYWNELDKYVGSSPSTLRLIFPEVYLEDGDSDKRIENINANMQDYLANGVFRTLENSYVLVKRDTAAGVSRLGIVAAIDLEDYCFVHPNNAAIRSTENVVEERIPPRLAIRRDAPIELPHIMLLIDDRKRSFIESFYAKHDELEKLYDFELNMRGGHLCGYRLDADEVIEAFDKYCEDLNGLYGKDTNFIFAVGDGNHSLATAQAHWNNVKKTLTAEQAQTHPARFALCEIENLHDDGISFEPIHRFVFGADEADFVTFMCDELSGERVLNIFSATMSYGISVCEDTAKAIADVQAAIDKYIQINPTCSVDYIHGIEHLRMVAENNEGIAIEMPKIEKNSLFAYVLENGTLCRKAFSMGEAEEKRYYYEAKTIK